MKVHSLQFFSRSPICVYAYIPLHCPTMSILGSESSRSSKSTLGDEADAEAALDMEEEFYNEEGDEEEELEHDPIQEFSRDVPKS